MKSAPKPNPSQKLTVSQAATRLRISPRHLRELCERHQIGELVSTRLRILTAADLPRISGLRRPPGNPNFKLKKKSVRKS